MQLVKLFDTSAEGESSDPSPNTKTPIFSLTQNYLTNQKCLEAERNKFRNQLKKEKEENNREKFRLLESSRQALEELQSLKLENQRIKQTAIVAPPTSIPTTTTHHALHQVTNFLLRLC